MSLLNNLKTTLVKLKSSSKVFIKLFTKMRPLTWLLLVMVVIVGLVVLIASRNNKKEITNITAVPKDVKVQTVAESKSLKEQIGFPAIVISSQQAKIFAKAGGTVKNVNFNVGDKVQMGDVLIKVDDVSAGGGSSAGFDSAQVKQAMLAVSQAAISLQLAQTSYQNTLAAADKDLSSAAIARDQASTGKSNLDITTSEVYKTAELNYQTAQTAAEQARLNWENAQNSTNEAKNDTLTNAQTALDAATAACSSIITGVNNITGLDENIDAGVFYKSNLGVLDSNSLNLSKSAYLAARDFYQTYQNTSFTDFNTKASAVINLAELTKKLAGAVKVLFDNSISSSLLPQSSLAGPSLSSLQATAAGYQSQALAALNQANGAKQGLANVYLSSNSTIENLQKVYELAQAQAATAKQNLASLKAGNKSQTDQAKFGSAVALNQYESIKAKLDSQIAAAKSQLDMAEIAYNNASVNLQSLYDAHLIITPIAGTVVQKSVSTGDTVTPGQLLATVGQPENIKFQFYVDQENLPYLHVGQPVSAKDANGNNQVGMITSLTPQADPLTKRFLVEASLIGKNIYGFALGTVADIALTIIKTVTGGNNIILPLSAIGISQSGSYIYIVDNNQVKKVAASIGRIEGEAAQIKVDLLDNEQIIIDGNKLVNEGDIVNIIK